MSRPTGYSISGYSSLIADAGRTAPYVAALTQAVRPGAVVLDIGAGTGFFSLLACRLGARRVYAVEPDNAIGVAREVAAANGCADRIEFIQELSTRITLPEPADVIVSDLRGVLPLFQHHLPSIVDARRRHLAPGGVLIPRIDRLWCAPAEAPELYLHHLGPPEGAAYGFDLRPALWPSVNTWCKTNAKREQLLADPAPWLALDYAVVESPDARGAVMWTVGRPGTLHGLLLWFDAELADGIGFSNAPGGPELIYGQAFFPLAAPVAVAAGDRVSAELAANLVSDDYIWRWDTTVLGAGGQVKAGFRQSTFFGAPLSPAQLRKRGAGYVPSLNADGQIRQLVLDRMDGHTPLGEIARALAEQYPGRFASWQEALAMVADLSQKYS